METLKKDYLLSGIKVIDAASFIAGPSAATIMSDYGAEVIKIEPQNGDSLRNLITNGRMPEGPENYCWELTSRNKKSVSLKTTVSWPRASRSCFCSPPTYVFLLKPLCYPRIRWE